MTGCTVLLRSNYGILCHKSQEILFITQNLIVIFGRNELSFRILVVSMNNIKNFFKTINFPRSQQIHKKNNFTGHSLRNAYTTQ